MSDKPVLKWAQSCHVWIMHLA